MEDLEATLRPGYTLDRYELLCPLASGGMATVWLARMQGKHGFEKLVAVKTIRGELVDDPRFEEMFLDEARIASGIQHPNVAHIIDLGEKDSVLYLVMEWVDGESLGKVRKFAVKGGAKVPLGIALRIIADACAGLHAAHEHRDPDGGTLGIVHRDVSPQNILISNGGAVKVIDFGVAKASNRLATKTRTGIVKGKLQYMAPEQAGGLAHDRRVDVWALGVCLYELIADRLPFDGDDQLDILRKLGAKEPPPPLGDDVPGVVKQVVAKALAYNPDDRFPTAAALRRAIESALSQLALPSTMEDVAAFIEEHLPERAVQRSEIVAKALKAAETRAEPVDAFGGTMEMMSGRTASTKIESAGRGSRSGIESGIESRRMGKALSGPASTPRISARAILAGEESNATLGSAALAAELPMKRGGGGKFVLLALVLVGGGIYYMWRKDPDRVRAVVASVSPKFANVLGEPPSAPPADSSPLSASAAASSSAPTPSTSTSTSNTTPTTTTTATASTTPSASASTSASARPKRPRPGTPASPSPANPNRDWLPNGAEMPVIEPKPDTPNPY